MLGGGGGGGGGAVTYYRDVVSSEQWWSLLLSSHLQRLCRRLMGIAMLQVGVLGDVLTSADKITSKGRLGPGQMVCADLTKGTFQNTIDLAKEAASAHPYSEWLKNR